MSSNIINLIRRDFYALMSEKMMGVMFSILLIMGALIASYLNFSSMIFLFLTIYSYIQNLFALDEKYHTEKYYASLPVRRSDIVMSRYVGVAVIAGINIILAYLTNALMLSLNIRDMQPIPASYCIIVFLTLAFLTSITYPFYFRFGITRAKAVSVLQFIIIGGLTGIMGFLAKSKGIGLAAQALSIFPHEIITSMFLIGAAVLLLGVTIPVTLALYSKKDL